MNRALEIRVYEEFEILGETAPVSFMPLTVYVPINGINYDVSWLVFNSIFGAGMFALPPTAKSAR